eukprot:2737086-Pyramimonas_sp.AAC.1
MSSALCCATRNGGLSRNIFPTACCSRSQSLRHSKLRRSGQLLTSHRSVSSRVTRGFMVRHGPLPSMPCHYSMAPRGMFVRTDDAGCRCAGGPAAAAGAALA